MTSAGYHPEIDERGREVGEERTGRNGGKGNCFGHALNQRRITVKKRKKENGL